jgi:alpha-galactosidase
VTDGRLRWATDAVTLHLTTAGDAPVRLVGAGPPGAVRRRARPPAQPLVEVLAVGHGHAWHSVRHTSGEVSARLRHVRTAETRAGVWSVLSVDQRDPATGLAVRSTLRAADGVPAVQGWTTVTNEGAGTVVLQAVSSLVTAAFTPEDLSRVEWLEGWSDWLAEGRWQHTPVRSRTGLVDLDLRAHAELDSRSRILVAGQGTWSTGERYPCGVLEDRDGGAWAWQVEHDGGWLAELSEAFEDGSELALGLFGPTDALHHWALPLASGESFTTVPASLAFAAGDWQDAVGVLTAHRRALRADAEPPRDTAVALPVVFNDYMNTLDGDPTSERVLPLVDAAAAAGAEYFCIDAGWYDDTGDWWDGVGEWLPSTRRFPGGGLSAVLDHVRERGMVPGLWLEPEVIGVRSPMIDRLPPEAFLQRYGVPVVEQGRRHLDLRHPAARAHLDGVVDRLVGEMGVGYLKLDYNITPGQGTDLDAPSPGVGLLGHGRALLDWLDGVLGRHPSLLLESCASGAMRSDYAILSRLHLQSTSDQCNPLLYPPVAAAAPMSVLPEQAASWAYPQPEMDAEQIAFTLVTGLLGRLYLSGHLNRMEPAQAALVRSAVMVHRAIRDQIARAVPVWPLGLPDWSDPWVATGLAVDGEVLVAVWHRGTGGSRRELGIPALAGREVDVEPVFPRPEDGLPAWPVRWRSAPGVLEVTGPDGAGARVLRLRPRGG